MLCTTFYMVLLESLQLLALLLRIVHLINTCLQTVWCQTRKISKRILHKSHTELQM